MPRPYPQALGEAFRALGRGLTASQARLTIWTMLRSLALLSLLALACSGTPLVSGDPVAPADGGGAGGAYRASTGPPDSGSVDSSAAEASGIGGAVGVGGAGTGGTVDVVGGSSAMDAGAGGAAQAGGSKVDGGTGGTVAIDAGQDAAAGHHDASGAIDAAPDAPPVLRCSGTATCVQTEDQGACKPIGCEEAYVQVWPDESRHCVTSSIGNVRCRVAGDICISDWSCEQCANATECAFDTRTCVWTPKLICLVQPKPCDQVSTIECAQHPGCALQ